MTLLRFFLACLLATPLVPWAQTYPSKLVRIVVPYEAGGGIDALARAMSEQLTPRWGRPVVKEKRIEGESIHAQSPNGLPARRKPAVEIARVSHNGALCQLAPLPRGPEGAIEAGYW